MHSNALECALVSIICVWWAGVGRWVDLSSVRLMGWAGERVSEWVGGWLVER